MKVSDAIRKIRWELRLSQRGLAKQVGCTQTSISAYELDQRHPKYSILKKLDELAKQNKIEVNFL
jgi:predicted transcriptional regulator